MYSNKFVILLKNVLSLIQGRSHWGIQGGHDTPTSISNQTRTKSFSFNHRGYCFLRMFRNYTDQKFHSFYRVYYNIQTICGGIFSNNIGEKDYLMLDLLKSFFLWVIRKKTTMKESFNLRLQVKSWTYRKTRKLNM